ncbi:hypothetical protein LTS10_004504 [Elasticomyces elasticus]|nr:hypothetical protein LTS10_004504 [Elasticomyces elasticus]
MSEELNDEVTSINAIYGDNTICELSEERTYALTLPNRPDIALRVEFPIDYPDAPPSILGTQHTGAASAKGDGAFLVDLIRDVLAEVYVPGAPCVFDLIETADQRLESFSQDGDATAEQEPQNAQGDGQHSQNQSRQLDRSSDTSAQTSADSLGEAPPWALSDVITEKKSIFVARSAAVSSVSQAKQYLGHLLSSDKKVAKATHNITAWRIRGDNGVQYQDCDDDGEMAAGGRLLHLMELMDVWNVMVVVSRWYGGVHLGPDRFRLINQAARDTLVQGEFVEEGKKKGKNPPPTSKVAWLPTQKASSAAQTSQPLLQRQRVKSPVFSPTNVQQREDDQKRAAVDQIVMRVRDSNAEHLMTLDLATVNAMLDECSTPPDSGMGRELNTKTATQSLEDDEDRLFNGASTDATTMSPLSQEEHDEIVVNPTQHIHDTSCHGFIVDTSAKELFIQDKSKQWLCACCYDLPQNSLVQQSEGALARHPTKYHDKLAYTPAYVQFCKMMFKSSHFHEVIGKRISQDVVIVLYKLWKENSRSLAVVLQWMKHHKAKQDFVDYPRRLIKAEQDEMWLRRAEFIFKDNDSQRASIERVNTRETFAVHAPDDCWGTTPDRLTAAISTRFPTHYRLNADQRLMESA